MELCLWIVALLHFISSFGATERPRKPLRFDVSQVQFSKRIENIFKAHCFSLACVATKYELEHDPTTFTQLSQNMCLKKLAQLLQEGQPLIAEICETDEVQQAFGQAYEKVNTAEVDERLVYWNELIQQLYKKQDAIRKEKIPRIWFPAQESRSRTRGFIEKNADIELSEMQQRCVIAYKVITVLPFAVIEQHDEEAFEAFLEARHAPQKQLNHDN